VLKPTLLFTMTQSGHGQGAAMEAESIFKSDFTTHPHLVRIFFPMPL
jgi:hypothetical protein